MLLKCCIKISSLTQNAALLNKVTETKARKMQPVPTNTHTWWYLYLHLHQKQHTHKPDTILNHKHSVIIIPQVMAITNMLVQCPIHPIINIKLSYLEKKFTGTLISLCITHFLLTELSWSGLSFLLHFDHIKNNIHK